ncbi:hypothetical protein BC936DRAFT_138364, partial [Jimgerdemannia flammicorona]
MRSIPHNNLVPSTTDSKWYSQIRQVYFDARDVSGRVGDREDPGTQKPDAFSEEGCSSYYFVFATHVMDFGFVLVSWAFVFTYRGSCISGCTRTGTVTDDIAQVVRMSRSAFDFKADKEGVLHTGKVFLFFYLFILFLSCLIDVRLFLFYHVRSSEGWFCMYGLVIFAFACFDLRIHLSGIAKVSFSAEQVEANVKAILDEIKSFGKAQSIRGETRRFASFNEYSFLPVPIVVTQIPHHPKCVCQFDARTRHTFVGRAEAVEIFAGKKNGGWMEGYIRKLEGSMAPPLVAIKRIHKILSKMLSGDAPDHEMGCACGAASIAFHILINTRFCKYYPLRNKQPKEKRDSTMKPIFILLILALVAGTFASPSWYNNQYFRFTSPIGARTWDTGSTQEITFTSNKLTFNVRVDLYQLKGGHYHFIVIIKESVSIGTGVATFNVPSNLAGNNYYVRITGDHLLVYTGPITIKKVGGNNFLAGDEDEHDGHYKPTPTEYEHDDHYEPTPTEYEHDDHYEPTPTEYEHDDHTDDHTDDHNDDYEPTPSEYEHDDDYEPTPTPTEYEHEDHDDHYEPKPTEYEHDDHYEPTPTEYEHDDDYEPTPTEYEHDDHYEPKPT